jgi:hypothetical protein
MCCVLTGDILPFIENATCILFKNFSLLGFEAVQSSLGDFSGEFVVPVVINVENGLLR